MNTSRLNTTAPYLLLAVVCLALYGRTLGGEFLNWDDTQHIAQNPWVIHGEYAKFWQNEYFSFYIPVSYTIWTMIYAVSAKAWAFHFLNIILHILNTYLVYLLARNLLPECDRKTGVIAALIFACHPLQVESVAWISGGRDLMAAFFGLAGTYLVLAYRWQAQIPATLLFALSLLSKPTLLILPVALLILFEARPVFFLWLVMSVTAGFKTIMAQKFSVESMGDIAVWDRVLVCIDSLGFYIRKFLLPWPLYSDYGRTPEAVVDENLYLLSAVFVLAFGGLIYWLKQKREWSTFHPLFFAGLMLIPVLGLVPFAAQVHSSVFDRYMYIPIIGLAIWLAPYARPYWKYALGILAVWSVLTVLRTGIWLDNRRQAMDMIHGNPQSYEGLNNLAITEIQAGKPNDAIPLLNQAREIKPDIAIAWANLAHAYWESRQVELIFKNIAPTLSDVEFLNKNTQQAEALALMNRMVARAYLSAKYYPAARVHYCRAIKLDRYNNYLQDEVREYLRTQNLVSCD